MVRRRDRIYMPAGVGGLIRYPEEEKEVFKIKPKHLIVVIILIIIFELLLRFF
jgi:preprotein translocase subunit Sec61beta